MLVVLDDVGFGDLGCYGAEHNTAAIDALASSGVRFNNFHVTALCAPTRACLLTGRNAHAAGVGNIAEWGRPDHPSYRGWIRSDAPTLAEILRQESYSTLAVGKWHLSSIADQNAAGPFDHWPTRRGFDRWYGFHGSAVDHWHPELFENTSPVYPTKSDDYHLSQDLVDKSIDYVRDHLAAAGESPFFLYLAFGACHFPLHAPKENIERYIGKYEIGWDEIRARRFRRQKQIGVVPNNAALAPRNDDVPAWTELSEAQRQITARGQEVYAAFLEHTDQQIHRLIEFLKQEHQFDDTIFVVLSDNGASFGGPVEGRFDVRRVAYQNEPETISEWLKVLDKLGTDDSYAGYSRGWAQASNTPLKWYKADTYEGGIRTPIVMSWPNGRFACNRIATQYHHAIDLAPALLEMSNLAEPTAINDRSVLPMQGNSFAYALDHPDAATTKRVQYFETMGDRAIWADGWKAVTRHHFGDPFDQDSWELYRTASDFSETRNLANAEPERLQSLIDLWFSEANKYGVLPMDDDRHGLYKQSVPPPRLNYTFFKGMTRVDRMSMPDIYSYSSRFVADVSLSNGAANGVIVAAGDSAAGYDWYMDDGFLCFAYVYLRSDIKRVRSLERIPAGRHSLILSIDVDGEGAALVRLGVDSEIVGKTILQKMWPIQVVNSGLRCGENLHAPISRDYSGSFEFVNRLDRVRVSLRPGRNMSIA